MYFSSPGITLAPMGKRGRPRRLSPAVRRWIEEPVPDIKGYNGAECPKCARTRILFVPVALFNGSIPSREWWRCCGLRVNGAPGIPGTSPC